MGHNILYIDDEAHNLDAFARVFWSADFVDQVFVTETTDEGFEILRKNPISAIVTDQRMPKMKGTEFLARVIPEHPDPVRLILTGYTDVEDIIEAINKGHVFYYITKPWEASELRVILRRALDHYEALQELKRKNRELAMAYENLEAAHREQVRLYERVIADEKTGTRNYHYFRIRLGEEFERARRYGHDLSLIMIDIDDFKVLNDEYGHLAGDQILRDVGGILAMDQRSIDVVARYGGAEFAIVLPETGKKAARAIAERLRERVASQPFEGNAGRRVEVTVSCGVATYPNPDLTSREELIQRADRALYRAKAQGKNRVEVDD